jgi:hypothetical protein
MTSIAPAIAPIIAAKLPALGKEDLIVLLFLLIAVLFGVLILAFVLVLSRDKHHKKRCPFCAETVMFDAKLCKHCGREFELTADTAID